MEKGDLRAEPSAEAREQIADHLREHSWVPCTNRGEAMPSGPWCSKCIARALADRDAEVAEAGKKVKSLEESFQDLFDDVEQRDTKIAALEADLAAMRGALERFADKAGMLSRSDEHDAFCESEYIAPLGDTPCDCADRIMMMRAALASSPGAAWLETAREVVEAYEKLARGRHLTHHGCMLYNFEDCQIEPCVEARALLARPEVKTWAGR